MENFHDFLMRELKEKGIQTATVLSVNKIVALRPNEVSEVIICMSAKDLENVDRISRAKWEEVFSEIGGKYYAQYGSSEEVDRQILSEIAIHNENFVVEGEHEIVDEFQPICFQGILGDLSKLEDSCLKELFESLENENIMQTKFYGTEEWDILKELLQGESNVVILNEGEIKEEHSIVEQVKNRWFNFEGQILVPTMKTIYNKRIRRDEAFVAYLAEVIMFC